MHGSCIREIWFLTNWTGSSTLTRAMSNSCMWQWYFGCKIFSSIFRSCSTLGNKWIRQSEANIFRIFFEESPGIYKKESLQISTNLQYSPIISWNPQKHLRISTNLQKNPVFFVNSMDCLDIRYLDYPFSFSLVMSCSPKRRRKVFELITVPPWSQES